ncbi:acyl-CoA dehydrogenase family protein [Micromonospora echinofusca]|uniref:acyl-CoA dehydrogenase family protein n=1 Tax=Micromonospora echinofusca TaxID=47858 RepID=UPI0033DE4DC0
MEVTQAPSRTELVKRATDLVPLLRKHAGWSEENRRLHDEVVDAMAEAGFFKMRVPTRYGGYESDTRTQAEVTAELARGDGSVGWTMSVWTIPGWMVGMFPDEVQDEVHATPDVRVCGTLSPSAMATPKEGGLVVNGQWGFISGAQHSHWQEIIAMAPTPDGAGLWPVMALVPMSDLEIVDDWYTAGMRGSGSVTTVARDVFVPQERVLPLPAVLQNQYASVLNADLPMYRTTLLGVAAASSVGTVVGLARAAREVFFERLPGRKITYTEYDSQREAPITHLRVAEAVMKIDQAEFHAHRVTGLVDDKGLSGESLTLEERARSRADVGAVCQLGKEAVDIFNMASGGSSIYNSVPIQRIARDVQVVNMHALMLPETNYELYGRVLCGLEPNSPYI